ncbi:MAG: hypothetical protein U5L95_01330 [Candidatus Saccharibacteria bacterium]|nr:hypothetical protein [Candidatus Saccharibacteria bacterium]
MLDCEAQRSDVDGELYEGYTATEWAQIDEVLSALPDAVEEHIQRAANSSEYDLRPQNFDERTVAQGIIRRLKSANEAKGDN